MVESILNGVLHLFALAAAAAGRPRDEAAALVDAFLHRALAVRSTGEYLALFTACWELYEGEPPAQLPARAHDLAAGLAGRLTRSEQHLVLLRLYELAGAADPIAAVTATAFSLPADAVADLALLAGGAPAAALSPRFVTVGEPASAAMRCSAAQSFRGAFRVLHCAAGGLWLLAPRSPGLTLDGNPLLPDVRYLLEQGNTLRDPYGNAVTFSELAAALAPPAATAVRFTGHGLEYRFPGSEHGLHGLDFCADSGQLIGIMGGSGAGKSTLLAILSGTLPPSAGQLLLNGRDLYRDAAALEGIIGLVPQDDLLFEDLTVFQNLYYSARLSLAHLPEAELAARVDRMLHELNQEATRDLRVGSPVDKTISGGQRKRLNIALELIREPAVLFVDEPTSGLSSADSENVMHLLRAQASRGRLVFVVIHQPSSAIFKQFDSLWVLDQGGYPVWLGPPTAALRYFRTELHLAGAEQTACPECGTVNPEQLFELITTRTVDEQGCHTRERRFSPRSWWERFRATRQDVLPAGDPPAALPETVHRPGHWGQWLVFLLRNARGKFANRQYLAVTLLEAPLLGLITALVARAGGEGAYVFGDNKNLVIYFFISVVCALFLGLSVSAEEIVRDRRILQRERFLHLSWTAYVNAKVVYLALVLGVQMALYAAVGTMLLAIPDLFVAYWSVLFACALGAGVLGLNVSAAFRTAVTVYILIPVLLIPQMLLGGVVIRFDRLMDREKGNAYVPLLGEVMAARWGVEAILVEQFRANRHQQVFFAVDRELSRCDYLADALIPELRARLDSLFLATARPDREEDDRRALAMLSHGVRLLEQRTGLSAGDADAMFNRAAPDRDRADALREWLTRVSGSIASTRAVWQDRKQQLTARLLAAHGEDGLAVLQRRHANKSLNDFVRNVEALESVRASGDRLIQVSDPVYQVPDSPWGRAPFGAGEKRLGPWLLPTYYFNLLVLWLLTLLCTAALWLRLPQRLAGLCDRRN